MVMSEQTAERQDIRPLQVALINLMPEKEKTETQFARLIGATPLQVELSLVRMSNHQSKNTSKTYLDEFYKTFNEIKARKFDGLIITGAPIEQLEFEEVTYWDELCQIFDWSKSNVHSTLSVCWGAMAMLNYLHSVKKYNLKTKAYGCFRHQNNLARSPFLRGISDDFIIPVSRWTEIKNSEIINAPNLELLLSSKEVGACFVRDKKYRALYIFNHIEYDTTTLRDEYLRDLALNKNASMPVNYFPSNNSGLTPENRWRSHAHLIFGNWLNEIYQTTPFNINEIGLL